MVPDWPVSLLSDGVNDYSHLRISLSDGYRTIVGRLSDEPNDFKGSIGRKHSFPEIVIRRFDGNRSEATSFGVETSLGFKVGGVGAEASVGVTNTSIYEVSVADSTEYSGSVSDIASDYGSYGYNFGIFFYTFTRDDGVKYQVINWVVE